MLVSTIHGCMLDRAITISATTFNHSLLDESSKGFLYKRVLVLRLKQLVKKQVHYLSSYLHMISLMAKFMLRDRMVETMSISDRFYYSESRLQLVLDLLSNLPLFL